MHLQDDSEAPVSTGPEEADTHFPTEPFKGLRVSQCCLPCPTAPRGRAHSAPLRTAPEPQAQESQSARGGWGPCSCARQDGWPSWGGREESPETPGLCCARQDIWPTRGGREEGPETPGLWEVDTSWQAVRKDFSIIRVLWPAKASRLAASTSLRPSPSVRV